MPAQCKAYHQCQPNAKPNTNAKPTTNASPMQSLISDSSTQSLSPVTAHAVKPCSKPPYCLSNGRSNFPTCPAQTLLALSAHTACAPTWPQQSPHHSENLPVSYWLHKLGFAKAMLLTTPIMQHLPAHCTATCAPLPHPMYPPNSAKRIQHTQKTQPPPPRTIRLPLTVTSYC